jgi:hypothetical protein
MVGIPGYVYTTIGEDITWTKLEGSRSGISIRGMSFLGTWEERIAVSNINGLYTYYRENQTATGPVRLNSSGQFGGAFDLVTLHDNVYLACDGPNGGIVKYEKYYQTGEYRSYNFTLYNVTEETRFHQIEFLQGVSTGILYLGSSLQGVGICNMSSRFVTFLNTTHGIPSNSITSLKLRGKTLLIGTNSGFALYDTESGHMMVRNGDEINDPLNVQCIDYYPQNHRIYVGTEDGLIVFEEDGENIEPISLQSRFTGLDGLETDNILALCLDKRTIRLYIGTVALTFIDLTQDITEITKMIARSKLLQMHDYPVIKSIIVPEEYGQEYLYIGTNEGYVVRVPSIISPNSTELATVISSVVLIAGFGAIIGIWAWFYRNEITLKLGFEIRNKLNDTNRLTPSYEGGVLTPDTPFSNVTELRNAIRSCTGYIWWFDKFFSKAGLETTISAIIDSSAMQIRILTGTSDKISSRLRRDFLRFQDELAKHGKEAELRVITNSALLGDIHDRWLISENTCYNLASIDSIMKGQFTEIKPTDYRPPFDEWWKEGFDIESEWNDIEKTKG